jgi:hypothetical protein
MENNRLRALLSKCNDSLENERLSDDTFVSINESMALRLRATYGGTVNNNACANNSGCSNNDNCSGNTECYGNFNCIDPL